MKQQPSATSKRPSRLCKFLLTLVGVKLCLLGLMLANPGLDFISFLPFGDSVAQAPQADAPVVAAAPAASAAPAAPAVPVVPATVEVAAASGSQVEASIAQPEQKPGVYPTRSGHRAPGVAFAAAPANPPAPRQGGVPTSLTLEALTRKQEELARQEQDLKVLQAELDQQFQQMQELELRLKIMLKEAEDLKDARYRHLVDVLSNMKARQAAEVLSTLDEKIAVRVLAGMRGRQAGEVLSLADPVKAARLAEALARMQLPLE